MSKLYKISEIDFERIDLIDAYSEETNKLDIRYDKKYPLFIEIPELLCIDKIEKINSNNYSHYLFVTLYEKIKSDNGKVRSFFDSLDDKFSCYIKKNINELSKFLDVSKEINYRSIIKNIHPKNEEDLYKNGLFKIKFFKKGNFETILFDGNNKIIKRQNYEKIFDNYSFIKTVVEIQSLLFKNNICKVQIKVHQVKFSNANKSEYGSLDRLDYVLSETSD